MNCVQGRCALPNAPIFHQHACSPCTKEISNDNEQTAEPPFCSHLPHTSIYTEVLGGGKVITLFFSLPIATYSQLVLRSSQQYLYSQYRMNIREETQRQMTNYSSRLLMTTSPALTPLGHQFYNSQIFTQIWTYSVMYKCQSIFFFFCNYMKLEMKNSLQ